MPSFQIPVLGFTVRFLSLYPVSLPQPFHRCLPSVFTSGIFRFWFAFFRPLSFSFQLLSFLFFLSFSSRFCLTACFSGARFRSRFFGFPFLSGLISRAFLPGFCTRLSVCFLSPFPDSLPQLFLRCLPYAFAFGLSPFDLLSFVRFSSGSGYSAFCFFLSVFFPFLPQQRLLRCTNFCFRFVGFPRSFKTRFPVFSFPVFVLGFL